LGIFAGHDRITNTSFVPVTAIVLSSLHPEVPLTAEAIPSTVVTQVDAGRALNPQQDLLQRNIQATRERQNVAIAKEDTPSAAAVRQKRFQQVGKTSSQLHGVPAPLPGFVGGISGIEQGRRVISPSVQSRSYSSMQNALVKRHHALHKKSAHAQRQLQERVKDRAAKLMEARRKLDAMHAELKETFLQEKLKLHEREVQYRHLEQEHVEELYSPNARGLLTEADDPVFGVDLFYTQSNGESQAHPALPSLYDTKNNQQHIEDLLNEQDLSRKPFSGESLDAVAGKTDLTDLEREIQELKSSIRKQTEKIKSKAMIQQGAGQAGSDEDQVADEEEEDDTGEEEESELSVPEKKAVAKGKSSRRKAKEDGEETKAEKTADTETSTTTAPAEEPQETTDQPQNQTPVTSVEGNEKNNGTDVTEAPKEDLEAEAFLQKALLADDNQTT
jgi:hypothetical protein